MAYPWLWIFEHLDTSMLGTEKSFLTEPTQLYKEYGMAIIGTVQLFCPIKG